MCVPQHHVILNTETRSRTLRRSLSGSWVTNASRPDSSTVCALSDSSVSPTANGVPGLLQSSCQTSSPTEYVKAEWKVLSQAMSWTSCPVTACLHLFARNFCHAEWFIM